MQLRCALGLLTLAGCTQFPAAPTDAAADDGRTDAPVDLGVDSAAVDAGPVDTGTADIVAVDAPAPDTGTADGGTTDVGEAGAGDTGVSDVGMDDGPGDAGGPDVNPIDLGPTDAGIQDTGTHDVGPADAGPTDIGPADTGPACAPPATLCGSACVDTTANAAHCGGCGVACSSGDACDASRCRRAQLLAIHPAIAAAGESVRIEGVFGDATSVNFPGAPGVSATVLGRNRIEVVVPEAATAGDLTVTSGSFTSAERLRFRRTTFPLGVGRFRRWYEQAEYARQTPTLSEARAGAVGLDTGSYYYLIGGAGTDGRPSATVERALINADGTLGPFERVPGTSLRTARRDAAIARLGNRVYILGGSSGVALDTIESAGIDTDGVLGAFSNVDGVTLASPRSGHVAEVIGRSIYVLGGTSTQVERALVDASGSFGSFVPLASVVTRRRSRPASVVADGHLYLIGGSNGGPLATVERAAIDGTGALGGFSPVASELGTPRDGARAVAFGSSLYVLGGSASDGSVERAPIGADGALGGFSAVGSLSTPRTAPTLSVIGNHLWLFGGGTAAGAAASLERASINASGRLSNFESFPVSLTVRANESPMFAIGAHLCVMSGNRNETNGVECTNVAADGSFGNFTPVQMGTPSPIRSAGATAVVGNFLYVFGGTVGQGAACCTLSSEVWRAPLGPAGVVGPFENTMVPLPAGNDVAAPAVIGAWLYSVGGNTSNRIVRTAIGPTGSLGSFNLLSTPTLGNVRSNPATAVFGSSLYVFGGQAMDGTAQSSTDRIALGADGSLSTRTDGSRLTTARISRGVVVGDQYYVISGSNGSSLMGNTEVATVNADGSVGPFVATTTAQLGYAGSSFITVGNYVYAVERGGNGLAVRRAVQLP